MQNRHVFPVAKSLYPREVLLYAIKYSPLVIDFEIDEKPDADSLSISINTKTNNFEELQKHLMERIQFSFLRYEIAQRTRAERELIIGRALYRSCVIVDEQ